MKHNRFVRTSSALVCAVVLAGCGESGNSSEEKPLSEEEALAVPDQLSVKNPAVVASSDIPAFPIEKYLPKVGEDARVAAASGELIRACMARFGFQYQPPVASQETLDSEENGANRIRRYGVSSASSAASYGYHLPRSSVDGLQSPEAPPMSDAENQVFIGDQDPVSGVKPGDKVAGKEIPAGGCSGEAQRRLKIEPRQRMAEKINNVSFARSQENSQVKEAFQEWSTCMARAGHSYKTPLEPLDNLTGKSPSPVEISAAKEDVKCKDSVNLVGVWFAVESKIQEELIARNEEVLTQDSKSFDALVRRASQELAKS
ncbi:hypothetical protein [Streptomyces sp. NPDC090029]|uniref:hypothetical protein n=1 Tax=Streptomyces sp. NPDC090029 TaxID=3365924 RepID=UPI003802DBA8